MLVTALHASGIIHPAARVPEAGFDSQRLPRIIWSYWHTEQPPWAVNDCMASWRRHAPEWEVRLLRAESVSEWLYKHYDYPENVWARSAAHQSDIFGLALLRRYGGLYMDASIILTQPLQWLEDIFERDRPGYFGYQAEQGIPEIFLVASEPRGDCVTAWWRALHDALADQPDGTIVDHLYPGAIGATLVTQDARFRACILASPLSFAGPYLVTRSVMQAAKIDRKEELVPALMALTTPLSEEILAQPLHKIQGASYFEAGPRPAIYISPPIS